MRKEIVIQTDENKLIENLGSRKDPEGLRMKRFLDMPDLSRTETSPIHEISNRIINIPEYKDFYIIKVPEIVPADISFDLFDFPADHPARSRSDTYYVDDKNILRTHTTVMWYYLLNDSEIKEKLLKKEAIGAFCFGKVYRKDEIDRRHMNIFHQMDGLYLAPKDSEPIIKETLQDVLVKIAQAVFGQEVKYRINDDKFPYTDPSLEMEIEVEGKWVEVLGSGLVRDSVLDKLGVDSSVYNAWAFGFGLERLAIISMTLPDIRLLWSQDPRIIKQLKLGNKFQEVSKYPPVTRDISFIVDKSFIPNDYFDLIRDIVGDLIEEVTLLDKYENAGKFGSDKVSYTYRIIYRSPDRTLKTDEVDPLQNQLYQKTKEIYQAQLR
ncbi:MAG: hypothetical protein KW793_00985 [Candidatus Doudnabacteria bacterium]|nr:hypothetical protein [Candidatus Doudnabacteria bacterium]